MAARKQASGKFGGSPAGFVVGREAFEAISAVEGIRPTQASRARAAALDRAGLSAEERRQAIIDAHRPKAYR